MSAEQLVAAAAAATGPIVDGDLAGWSEQVRRAASAAVVIAADMERLLEALADPELKMHVRKVTGVTQEKGRFIVSYTPPIEVSFKGQTTSYNDFRTGWVEEPHARQIARTARESIGSQCIFFQLNEHNEGDAEAPASGYRRLIHLEPVPVNGREVARQDSPRVEQPPRTPDPGRVDVAPAPQRQMEPPAEAAAPAAADRPPVDSALMDKVVSLISAEQVSDNTATLSEAALDAYHLNWWNTLGRDGQATIRHANDAASSAGRPSVVAPHDPKTVGDLKLIANFSRGLSVAPVPA